MAPAFPSDGSTSGDRRQSRILLCSTDVYPDRYFARSLAEALQAAGHQLRIAKLEDPLRKLENVQALAQEDPLRELENFQALDQTDFLIVLLSRPSLHSEVLALFVQRAQMIRRYDMVRPVILPVRMQLDPREALPYSLRDNLQTLQHRLWRSDADTPKLIREILDIVRRDPATLYEPLPPPPPSREILPPSSLPSLPEGPLPEPPAAWIPEPEPEYERVQPPQEPAPSPSGGPLPYQDPIALWEALYQETPFHEGITAEEMGIDLEQPPDYSVRRSATTSLVDCSVFGPHSLLPAEPALIQVFVHCPNEFDVAKELAERADRDTSPRTTKTLCMKIEYGAELHFQLSIPHVDIDTPIQSLIWHGGAESVDFIVTAPATLTPKTTFGTVIVSRNSVPLGSLKFKLTIDRQATVEPPTPISSAARRFRKAFVSYSTQDQQEVLKRVQVLVRTGIEVFQDLLSLTPGERYERRLFEEIAHVDLFLLFWSAAARESEWVIREAQHALECQGIHPDHLPEIIPIILEQEFVEPPPELQELHFRDVFTYLIAAC